MHQSSETSPPAIFDQWPDWWISSLRASRANPIASPEPESELLTRVTSGRIPSEPLARLDRLSLRLKTYLASLPEPEAMDIYLAGLIDGEGTISIWGSNQSHCYPTVQIGMSAKALPLLREMHEHYGGTLVKFREATFAWSAGWMWSIFGDVAKALIGKVYWSLRLKRSQATLAMRLFLLMDSLERPTGKNRRWTPKARQDAVAFATLMKELNMKGPKELSAFAQNHPWLNPHIIWVEPQLGFLHSSKPLQGNFPKWGIASDGALYRQPTPAPPISANAGGVWPTPSARDTKDSGSEPSQWNRNTPGLSVQVQPNYPTPQSRDYRTGERERAERPQRNLNDVVAMWPTPRASRTGGADSHGVLPPEFRGGKLNPRWVEWLMGVPIGWLALEPLEMESYRQWRQSFCD